MATASSSATLAAREAELVRLNEELDRNQRQVVQEADEALNQQESRLDAILGRSASASTASSSAAAAAAAAAVSAAASASAAHSKRPGGADYARDPRDEDERKHPTANTSTSARGKPLRRPSPTASGASSPQHLGEEIGTDAVIRLQRAKLKVLSEDLEKAMERAKATSGENAALKQRFKEAKEEATKSKARLAGVEAARDREKRDKDKLRERLSEAERQLANANKELKQTGRAVKQVESEGTSKDLRLNRALDEIERLKDKVSAAEAARQDSAHDVGAEAKKLRSEMKRLERQKQELLGAIRKQLKLIDVLKRQKMHLEAAKMLAFSEDEFTRTLESQHQI